MKVQDQHKRLVHLMACSRLLVQTWASVADPTVANGVAALISLQCGQAVAFLNKDHRHGQAWVI